MKVSLNPLSKTKQKPSIFVFIPALFFEYIHCVSILVAVVAIYIFYNKLQEMHNRLSLPSGKVSNAGALCVSDTAHRTTHKTIHIQGPISQQSIGKI